MKIRPAEPPDSVLDSRAFKKAPSSPFASRLHNEKILSGFRDAQPIPAFVVAEMAHGSHDRA